MHGRHKIEMPRRARVDAVAERCKTTLPRAGPRTKEETECGASTGTSFWGGGSIVFVWNTTGTARDGDPLGCIPGVVVRDDGAATNEAPRADEEAG